MIMRRCDIRLKTHFQEYIYIYICIIILFGRSAFSRVFDFNGSLLKVLRTI